MKIHYFREKKFADREIKQANEILNNKNLTKDQENMLKIILDNIEKGKERIDQYLSNTKRAKFFRFFNKKFGEGPKSRIDGAIDKINTRLMAKLQSKPDPQQQKQLDSLRVRNETQSESMQKIENFVNQTLLEDVREEFLKIVRDNFPLATNLFEFKMRFECNVDQDMKYLDKEVLVAFFEFIEKNEVFPCPTKEELDWNQSPPTPTLEMKRYCKAFKKDEEETKKHVNAVENIVNQHPNDTEILMVEINDYCRDNHLHPLIANRIVASHSLQSQEVASDFVPKDEEENRPNELRKSTNQASTKPEEIAPTQQNKQPFRPKYKTPIVDNTQEKKPFRPRQVKLPEKDEPQVIHAAKPQVRIEENQDELKKAIEETCTTMTNLILQYEREDEEKKIDLSQQIVIQAGKLQQLSENTDNIGLFALAKLLDFARIYRGNPAFQKSVRDLKLDYNKLIHKLINGIKKAGINNIESETLGIANKYAYIIGEKPL